MHLKRDSAPAPEHLIEDVDVAAPNDPAGKSASRPAGCARRPVSVRLSDREVAIVSAAAAAKGIPATAFMRRSALKAAGRPTPPIQHRRDELAKNFAGAMGLLGRIASSSNQVARLANSGAVRSNEVAAILSTFNAELSELRRLFINAERSRT